MDFHLHCPYNEVMDKIILEQPQPATQPQIAKETELALQEPSLYHVILLNDDYTPMDFVIEILMHLFHKNYDDAHAIMMQVHVQERGIAGTYSREIAEEKINQVNYSAQANDFPLTCILEAA